MAPTEQVVSRASTSSSGSNVRSILDALAVYSKITGIDLSKNRFASMINQADDSPEGTLQLFQERENAFKFPDGNQRLTSALNDPVRVIFSFSGVLSEAVGTIPLPPRSALFAGIDTLLAAAAGNGFTSGYDALLDLFECLGSFLRRLEIYTMIPPTPILTEIIVKIMFELLSVLALAYKQIKEGRLKKFAKLLLKGPEMEPVLQRLDRLTQDEARITVAQTLGVVHGLVESVKAIMEDGKASTDGIRNDLVALYQVLNDLNKTKREQLRWQVQHWLSPPDPSRNQNFVRRARLKGTAAWFFESSALAEWKSRGSLLWIHGKPGAGKSTLLSAVIQEIERMHTAGLATMAYYYFDFGDVKKQDCYGLLSSLVQQLSADSDAFYDVLSKLYSYHLCGTRKPDIDALKECMTDMLNLPGQGPVYIIVDALDECPNFPGRPSARKEVLEFVEELVSLELPDIHLCVASRPEVDIRMILEPLTSLRISLHDEIGQKGDIIKYINSVVRSDRNMWTWEEEDLQLVADTLSDNADGMFRWMVCQVDCLCRCFPVAIRNVLADLPRSLDVTYEKALLGINEEKRKYALRLYQCLMVSIRPLRVEELAEILAVRFDEAVYPMFNAAWRPKSAEGAVMSACSSLIAIIDRGDRQVVQFSHFSVKDYLTSERLSRAEERLSYYHILPEHAHATLAHASLSVLLQLNDRIDRNTIDRFPLALYAARHWIDHAQFEDVSSHVQELMERLFDPAMPQFAAWIWLYDIDRQSIEPMSGTHPTRPKAVPLYYASLCGFYGLAEHLLVAHPQDVNARGGHHVTSLNAALDKGHVKVAQLLLRHGADVNALDGQYRTPLHIAAEYGYTEVIQSLIEQGADTNAKDLDQSIPLSLASRRGRRAAAQLLLEHGADVGLHDSIGRTPMREALDNGHVEIVRLLLDRGADASAQGRSLRTPLHLAAGRGALVLSQLLLEHGAEVDFRDKMDWTPLHLASEHGDPEILRLLISKGANPDARSKDQETPLFLASRKGRLDAARLLSEHGTDTNSQDSLGRTPLHVAAENGHCDIVSFLLDHGADISARERNLRTPLHLTADQGKVAVAELLLGCGADIDAQDKMDGTPLHVASQQGHLDFVRLLLEHNADILALNHDDHTFLDVAWASGHKEIVDINARYEDGQTALHIAAQHGDPEFMRWLIDRKVDPLDPRAEDEDQETPLFPASKNGKLEATRLLLDAGADANHRDWQEMTPLHGASEKGHVAVTQLLLDRDAAVNAEHVYRWTPLHLASQAGKGKAAEVLLGRGAMVNAKNDSAWTPLHIASQKGHLDVVELLLTNDADVDIENEDGETALHLAAFYGHLEVTQILLKKDAKLRVENKEGKTALVLASKEGHLDIAQLLRQTALIRESGGESVSEQQVGERRKIAQ